MEINQFVERITILDITTMITLVAMVIAFTKGITEVFKVKPGYKQLVTVLMAVWLVLMVVLTNAEQQAINLVFVVKLISTIILVFFGASGVYNLLPSDKIVEMPVEEIPQFENDEIKGDI